MYAILGQDKNGLQWLANTDNLVEAKEMIDAGDFKEYDAVLVVTLQGFAQQD